MSKKTKFGEKVEGGKKVKVAEPFGLYRLTPKWSFMQCDLEHEKWGILKNKKYLDSMLRRFKVWEQGTWGEIFTATSGRKHNTQSHAIPIAELVKEVPQRLRELKIVDEDTLYSLAITGKQRVWGTMIIESGTFRLLWYDPQHEIYPVHKK